MELTRAVLNDKSDFGKQRANLYFKLKEFYDRFRLMEFHEVASAIDDSFGNTNTYSLGRTDYQLKALIKDLKGLSGSFPAESGVNTLITYLENTQKVLEKITLDKTSLDPDSKDIEVVNTTSNGGVFKISFTKGKYSIEVTENSEEGSDAIVEVFNNENGRKSTFEINDNGKLYKTIIEIITNDTSLNEAYKRGNVVKDMLDNHYKITKVESDHYKIADTFGNKTFVKKDNFEQTTKRTRKKYVPEMPSALKEDRFSVGQNVKTSSGEGKITKMDKDDVWISLDKDSNIGGKQYKKGTEIAVKDAALVKEEFSADYLTNLALDVKAKLPDQLNMDLFKIKDIIIDYVNAGTTNASDIAKAILKDVVIDYIDSDRVVGIESTKQ